MAAGSAVFENNVIFANYLAEHPRAGLRALARDFTASNMVHGETFIEFVHFTVAEKGYSAQDIGGDGGQQSSQGAGASAGSARPSPPAAGGPPAAHRASGPGALEFSGPGAMTVVEPEPTPAQDSREALSSAPRAAGGRTELSCGTALDLVCGTQEGRARGVRRQQLLEGAANPAAAPLPTGAGAEAPAPRAAKRRREDRDDERAGRPCGVSHKLVDEIAAAENLKSLIVERTKKIVSGAVQLAPVVADLAWSEFAPAATDLTTLHEQWQHSVKHLKEMSDASDAVEGWAISHWVNVACQIVVCSKLYLSARKVLKNGGSGDPATDGAIVEQFGCQGNLLPTWYDYLDNVRPFGLGRSETYKRVDLLKLVMEFPKLQYAPVSPSQLLHLARAINAHAHSSPENEHFWTSSLTGLRLVKLGDATARLTYDVRTLTSHPCIRDGLKSILKHKKQLEEA